MWWSNGEDSVSRSLLLCQKVEGDGGAAAILGLGLAGALS
ncbi:hypothetical protein A2U01_0069464, partial [Trifolium medium]|nr:hypothetical protein [Trifolium medium]